MHFKRNADHWSLGRKRLTIRSILSFSVAAASCGAAHSALATTRTWLDTDGLFWGNTAGWQGGVVPVAGDTVNIGTLSASSNPTLLYNGSYTIGSPLVLLDIDATHASAITFAQSLGAMAATTEIIGDTTFGNFYSQNGGTNTANSIVLGNQSGGNGNYSLSGTGTVTTAFLTVGSSGVGNFSQSGGNVTISNDLGIGGANVSGNSTYSLSGGNLTLSASAFAAIGGVPHAAFTQTGGTFNLNGSPLYIDSSSIIGNSVVVSLSNGSIINAGLEELGSNGSGTMLFSQTGGTHSFVTGGLLDLGNFGAGAYSLSNGTLNTYAVNVGDAAAGTFTQSGGTHTASNNVTIGDFANGFYSFSNGSLTAANETIGFANGVTGNFQQTGGTHTVTNTLTLANNNGSIGVYSISAGSLTVGNATTSGTINLGNSGSGGFTQSGGNVTLLGSNGYLGIADSNGGSGSYTISNGTLATATIEIGSGGGGFSTFTQTGGTVSVTALRIATSSGETSTFYLDSSAGASFLSVGNEIVGFSGNASFQQNGGTHIVNGNLSLAQGGSSTVQYTLTAGTLSANTLTVGTGGNATLTQTGGSLTVGSTLLINALGNTSLKTAYSLQGGSLSTPSTFGALVINPGGSFTEAAFFGAPTSFSGYINNYGAFTYAAGTFSGTLENDLTGTVTISNNSVFTANAGILNKGSITLLANTTIASGSGGTLDNENNLALAGGTIAGAGQIINNGLLFGFGALAGTGGFTNSGYLSAINGNILFSTNGTDTNAGTIALSPGHQFTLSSTASLTNNGTFSLASGLLNGAGLFFNAAPGSLAGPGTITSPFINTGSVSPGAGTLLITTAWTNNGSIQPTGVGSQLTGGLITNNASIQGAGTIAAAVNNNGTIEATGGVLVFTGALTNSATGTLRASPNNKILIQGTNFSSNAGLIDLVGGTFDNGGQPLNNTGQITGFGVLSTGGLTNNGSLTFTGGTTTLNGPVTNAAAHTIIAKDAPSIFTGPVTNNGTIVVTNTTVTFTGNYSGNAYISDPSTNIFQANVSVNAGGSMAGGAGDQFLFNGGTVSNAGTFTNAGLLQTSDNITNSGNFTQTGPQSWSAAAGFTNTAGTATFGSNAKLGNLTITGGTVNLTTSMFIIEPPTKSATLIALQANAANGSLTASGLTAHLGLAIIDNGSLATPFTTFGGLPADAGSILIAPELLGDANIDGHVDLTDLNTVLNHLGTTQGGWTAGNFDGAATIDLTDLNDVLNDLGLTYAKSSAVASVVAAPEPASFLILAFGLPLVHRRKRRD